MAFIIDGVFHKDFNPLELDVGEDLSDVPQEMFQQYNTQQGTTEIKEPSELGDVLKNLNDDSVEPNTSMSGIDLRSRLSGFEIPPLMCVDIMVAMKFLPKECLGITRQKKRLSVSLKGEGRNDIIKIVNGKQEQDKAKGGMMNPMNWGGGKS